MKQLVSQEYLSQLNKPFTPQKKKTRVPKKLRKYAPLRWIWKRVHKDNEDVIIIICGPTGKGKTTLATYLAETLDLKNNGVKRFPYFKKDFVQTPEFIQEIANYDPKYSPKCVTRENFNDIVPRFCFGQKQRLDYWEWINNHRQNGHDTTAMVGVFDEAQSLYSRKEHYSHKNREAVNQLITGRWLNSIQIFIGPEYERIDKDILSRVHVIIQVVEKGYSQKKKKDYIGWKAFRPRRLGDDIIPHWFTKRDRTLITDPYYTPMPSNFLWRLVHAKELFFKTSDLNTVYKKPEKVPAKVGRPKKIVSDSVQ